MFSFSSTLSETAKSCNIHALRGSSLGANEKGQLPSLHVHPPSVRRSGLTLVAEHLEEATLSGRLCERKVDGTAWSWDPWRLRVGMTECGATGAGRHQMGQGCWAQVHCSLKLENRLTWAPWTQIISEKKHMQPLFSKGARSSMELLTQMCWEVPQIEASLSGGPWRTNQVLQIRSHAFALCG